MSIRHFLICGCVSLAAVACTSDREPGGRRQGSTETDGGDEPTVEGGVKPASCDVVVKDADCDKSLRPFVFVHGTFGAGNNFAHVASLMTSNGYCPDRIVGVEYDSIPNPANQDYPGLNCVTAEDASAPPKGCGKIDDVVNDIMKKTGFDQVDIAGHSQGTRHCGLYLQDPEHAKKVAHYINFSGSPMVGDVQTLSLSSEHDLGLTPHHAIGKNVTEFTLKDEDHFAVAASTRSFVQVYKYLVGKEPKYKTIQCGDATVDIEGIAETFADNWPVTGKVEIREVGDTPRAEGSPLQTIRGDATGHFGPIKLKRGVAYEFKGFDDDDKLVGYSYFTPFKRSNRLVRLLIPPHDPGIAAASTDKVTPTGKGYSALLAQWSGGAFRYDLGASLKIDGDEVLTDENAGNKALMTQALSGGVVGFFMWDKNQNGKSDLGLVDSTSFIAYTDVFVDATESKFVNLEFTPGSEDTAPEASAKAKIANWPSENDVLTSVTFQ
jgi:pimeloyl-ACP methyl ester carboxylesterase